MKHKDQILKLREQGCTYPEIQTKLGCSKGTIAYHCGKGQKEKTKNRTSKFRGNSHPLLRKIEWFHETKNYTQLTDSKSSLHRSLYDKIHVFSRVVIQNTKGRNMKKGNKMNFSVQELLSKIGDNPKCALTGRAIDLSKTRSYELDHITPRSKGGDNSLDNCQILCKDANRSKLDLFQEEFIQLCRDVINYIDKNN